MRLVAFVPTLLVLCNIEVTAKQLKFLFFAPTYGHSHLQFHGALADILVDAGHTAHVLIPELIPGMKSNGTVKAQRVIRFKLSVPSKFCSLSVDRNPFVKHAIDITRLLQELSIMNNITKQVCEDIIRDKELINELRVEHYDLGFTEIISYCSLGLMRHIGVRSTAVLSAMDVPDLLAHVWALPSPPSYVTDMFRSFLNSPRLTFLQRTQNVIFSGLVRSFAYPHMLQSENEIFKRLVGGDFPDLDVIARDVAVAFVNTPQVVTLPRPTSSKIVHIGGIALKDPSKLSKQFSSIFSRAKRGVVLFSMGSIVKWSVMPPSVLNAFFDAFARFPDYEFIVKLDGDSLKDYGFSSQYSNIHAFKWIDQVAILGHPSTKAFITHSGLNSIIESMYLGTPMICIPLFADQDYNTAMAIEKDVAVFVDKINITTDSLTDALDRVLRDERFAENSRMLRDKLNNHPVNSKQLFLKWSEYTAKFGMSSEFNLQGSEMGTIQYFSLDILFILLFITMCLFFIIFKVIARILIVLWMNCAYVQIFELGSSKEKDE